MMCGCFQGDVELLVMLVRSVFRQTFIQLLTSHCSVVLNIMLTFLFLYYELMCVSSWCRICQLYSVC